jgi:AraC-like DNA-binding protein
VLKDELEAENITVMGIELGRITLDIHAESETKVLRTILKDNGFSLIDSLETKITEEVKIELIKMLADLPLHLDKKLSAHLSEKMHLDYSKLSKVFSFTEGITLEKYFIKLKIEKVKELIQVMEHNFTEIAQLLDYSHINHLSSQFRSETGMSLTEYKSQHKNFRNSLDRII